MQEDGRSCDQVDMPAKLVGWLRPVDWRGMISPLEGSDVLCLCWANRDTWQARVDLRQPLGRGYGRELLPSQGVEW